MPSRLQRHLAKHSAFYILVGFLIATTLAIRVTLPLAMDLSGKTSLDFINASASAMGGMLAILFAFSTLVASYAVDHYPPEFYRLSGYDNNLDAIYFALGGSMLGQFCLGLAFNDDNPTNRSIVTLAALVLVFLSVYLLFLGFARVRQRLDPVKGLERIHGYAIGDLDRAAKYMQKHIAVLGLNPKLSPDEKKGLPYAAFMGMEQNYRGLNDYLGFLYDYHNQLAQKSNSKAALKVLNVICLILLKYIDVNKSNVPPTQVPGTLTLTTLAERFFNENYERLNETVNYYLKGNNEPGISKIADVYIALLNKLVEMEFPAITIQENPEFQRAVGYLSMLTDTLAQTDNGNAAYYLVKAWARAGELSVAHHLPMAIQPVYDNLEKLATMAARLKHRVLQSQVATAYVMIGAKYQDHQPVGIELRTLIGSLDVSTLVFLVSSSVRDYDTAALYAAPYKNLANKIIRDIGAASNSANSNRLELQRQTLNTLEEMHRGLQSVCDKFPLVDLSIVLQYSETIEALCTNLLPCCAKTTWQQNSSELESQLRNFAYLYGWFVHNVVKVNNNWLDTVAESAGRLALAAIQNKQDNVAIAAIQSVDTLARALLKNFDTRALHEAPRTMNIICHLATASLQLGRYRVAEDCRKTVRKFNADYARSYFAAGLGAVPSGARRSPPYPNQTILEFRHFIHDMQRRFTLQRPDPPVSDLVSSMPGANQEFYEATLHYLKHR
jgi:hypothetical protein